jgi:hypothetical protein
MQIITMYKCYKLDCNKRERERERERERAGDWWCVVEKTEFIQQGIYLTS